MVCYVYWHIMTVCTQHTNEYWQALCCYFVHFVTVKSELCLWPIQFAIHFRNYLLWASFMFILLTNQISWCLAGIYPSAMGCNLPSPNQSAATSCTFCRNQKGFQILHNRNAAYHVMAMCFLGHCRWTLTRKRSQSFSGPSHLDVPPKLPVFSSYHRHSPKSANASFYL